jgi:hypothetical protein
MTPSPTTLRSRIIGAALFLGGLLAILAVVAPRYTP